LPRLPVLSSKEVIKALKKAGFYVHHQKGSHVSLRREGPPPNRIVVPDHKELKTGMLRAIIRQAGLNVDEFMELLNK